MVVTGSHWFGGGKRDVGDVGGGGQGWAGRVKEVVEMKDPQSWGNGSRYNVA